MGIVRQLLEDKSCQVWYVTPSSSVLEALKLMAEKRIGAVVVVEGGKIVGIFSERDFARKAISGQITMHTPVREIMVSPVYYVTPDQTVEDCMVLMTQHRFRHLPVLEDNQLVGIISIGDVVKRLLVEKDAEIKSLEDYIWVNMI
ncbi:CBS domain-containing protein [uncultured Thermanaerothrix sp.]|uniref:CBS domain-containing protein n=1 Tax=uncultured Thermanaerothrix sp. TaxID=1195149 RepID=UPI00261A325F|nr:CBS domain-containing protein [uncultured Thermanaerothrix sp.]